MEITGNKNMDIQKAIIGKILFKDISVSLLVDHCEADTINTQIKNMGAENLSKSFIFMLKALNISNQSSLQELLSKIVCLNTASVPNNIETNANGSVTEPPKAPIKDENGLEEAKPEYNHFDDSNSLSLGTGSELTEEDDSEKIDFKQLIHHTKYPRTASTSVERKMSKQALSEKRELDNINGMRAKLAGHTEPYEESPESKRLDMILVKALDEIELDLNMGLEPKLSEESQDFLLSEALAIYEKIDKEKYPEIYEADRNEMLRAIEKQMDSRNLMRKRRLHESVPHDVKSHRGEDKQHKHPENHIKNEHKPSSNPSERNVEGNLKKDPVAETVADGDLKEKPAPEIVVDGDDSDPLFNDLSNIEQDKDKEPTEITANSDTPQIEGQVEPVSVLPSQDSEKDEQELNKSDDEEKSDSVESAKSAVTDNDKVTGVSTESSEKNLDNTQHTDKPESNDTDSAVVPVDGDNDKTLNVASDNNEGSNEGSNSTDTANNITKPICKPLLPVSHDKDVNDESDDETVCLIEAPSEFLTTSEKLSTLFGKKYCVYVTEKQLIDYQKNGNAMELERIINHARSCNWIVA